MDKKNWILSKSTNEEFLRHLSSACGVSPILAQILINRDLKTPEDVDRFLNPTLDYLQDPFRLPDMERAVARIREAVQRRERVLVFGDYDADGLTSTVIMMEALEALGLDVAYKIPNRLTDGYGLSEAAIESAAREGRKLVITVDCGISANREAEKAAALGVDLIITDHHRQTGALPRAVAVVNPYRSDSEYPFQDLAGVGVAWKLAEALHGRSWAVPRLDLVALGTIADVVPLLDENRAMVWQGIRLLASGNVRPGLRAICRTPGKDRGPVTSERVAFSIAPRLNSAGRMGEAAPALALLQATDIEEAERYLARLDELNRLRRDEDEALFLSAMEKVRTEGRGEVVILASKDWHPGVLGIVASRLVEELGRPAILLSIENGLARGSGRSIPPFNLTESLGRCASLLEGFGGHHQAAGVRLRTENLEPFRAAMACVYRERMKGKVYVPSLRIEAAVGLGDVTENLVREIERLEPFGLGNEQPVLGCRGASLLSQRVVGKGHLKMRLGTNRISVDSILFSAGDRVLDRMRNAETVDVAFVPRINVWQDRRSVQLIIQAVRLSRG